MLSKACMGQNKDSTYDVLNLMILTRSNTSPLMAVFYRTN